LLTICPYLVADFVAKLQSFEIYTGDNTES